ncbi:MAG: dipeptide epimerase [Alphaproteobacteria bacterium]|nr:dipeptide epimerase [Alphaproteobacteria bacterium]
MLSLSVKAETWPLAHTFAISRGAKTSARVVVARLSDGSHIGRGECVPYARYGESVDSVSGLLKRLDGPLAEGLDRSGLQQALPAGAARNALDCAFWDLEAKRSGTPAWRAAGLDRPQPVTTAYTLSLDLPDAMGEAAAAHADRPVLKLKVTGPGDLDRIRAVHQNAPAARLIVDANEAWTADIYRAVVPHLADLGVVLLEQPFPADADAPLAELPHPVPVCADESCHDRDGLEALTGRYDAVNIKLDKTGGLTEALALAEAARARDLKILVGCMVATSLAMAPALLLAHSADFVDLDGPLLLARDREPGLVFDRSTIIPPDPQLWG